MVFIAPVYLAFALPGLALSVWAQWRVKKTFNQYSKVGLSSHQTGADVAREILQKSGLDHVKVERVQGFLSDHYDPKAKVLRLSPQVYDGHSVAAAGVAAHEAGHAIQDQQNYVFLQARTAMVPAVKVSGIVGPLMFLVGWFVSLFLAWIGLWLFGLSVIFSLITLPVEIDASNRAKQLLTTQALAIPNDMVGVNSVLNAAAFTYVATSVQSIGQLLYYVTLLNLRK